MTVLTCMANKTTLWFIIRKSKFCCCCWMKPTQTCPVPPPPRVKKASFCKIHKVTRRTCLHVWEAGKLWDDITRLSSNNSLTVRDGVSTVGLIPLGRGGAEDSTWDSVGELAQAQCHCLEGGKQGRGEGGWLLLVVVVGGHWMWKPVWLISNREEGGGAPLLSGPNPSPSPICWWGVLRSAASPDNEALQA